jgi:hypothetical protein
VRRHKWHLAVTKSDPDIEIKEIYDAATGKSEVYKMPDTITR